MESMEDEMGSSNNLAHIGIKRRSGRYPWNSGKDEYQRSKDFKAYYNNLRSQGISDPEIAKFIQNVINQNNAPGERPTEFTTTHLRAANSVSTNVIRTENVNTAAKLAAKGMSNIAIAERMGLGRTGESSVRGWLKTSQEVKDKSLESTINALKNELKTKEYLDVGAGTHLYLGVPKIKLDTALIALRDEGYNVWSGIKLPQAGIADQKTTYKVLTKGENAWKDAKDAVFNGDLKTIAAQSDDGGLSFKLPSKSAPIPVDLKRIEVNYADTGGATKDGVIELRRGAEDISLGKSNYAQVRIAVGPDGGTHYLKGMAMYADDLPAGVDIRFNTNKFKSDPKIVEQGMVGAMKPVNLKNGKIDPDSPFGAQVQKPRIYTDKDGKQKTSPINIVNDEGSWDDWSRSLSSQMLSKQSLTLAKNQLESARKTNRESLDKILKLTNEVVKEKMLQEFADSADAAAVHLKAASLPRQVNRVLLPLNNIRPHEIYAPGFNNGEKVVLVRHPHAGPFEIPELTVNNKSIIAKRVIGDALDAVGIHHTVAEQLSGADFDGDSVLVIPNNSRRVKNRPPLEKLKGFDAKAQYKIPDDDTDTRRMTKRDTQKEMGKISNLITDMSLQGASDVELARAVRHSMVVIDAEKHGLNYKQSEFDNNIKQLKEKYQGKYNAGAATLISRAGADVRVPERKQLSGARGIDPKTGEKVFVETGRTYQRPIKKNGVPTGEFETVRNTTKGARASFVKDARELLSGGKEGDPITPDRGYPMERIYADHSNAMKAMANEARRAQVNLKLPTQNKTAAALYHKEVQSLQAKLREAQRNAPLERRAQSLAREWAQARIDANPNIDDDAIKKIRGQTLEQARLATGASKKRIGAIDPDTGKSTLTDREWDAIQAGAIAKTTLRDILRNADMERVTSLATPRPRTALTSGQLARAKQMAATGRSVSEIADLLDLPRSTVADNLKNG